MDDYMAPPSVVDTWHEYKSNRLRDMALVSFDSKMLTPDMAAWLDGRACLVERKPERETAERPESE